MKRSLCCFYHILLCLGSMCQSAPGAWSLQQCIDTAVKNNVSIRQAAQQLNVARISRDQAAMNRWPSASLTTPVGVQFGRSINPITNGFTSTTLIYQNYSISGNFPLISWGKLQHLEKAQSCNLQAAGLTVAKTENDVALRCRRPFRQETKRPRPTPRAMPGFRLFAAVRFRVESEPPPGMLYVPEYFSSESASPSVEISVR